MYACRRVSAETLHCFPPFDDGRCGDVVGTLAPVKAPPWGTECIGKGGAVIPELAPPLERLRRAQNFERNCSWGSRNVIPAQFWAPHDKLGRDSRQTDAPKWAEEEKDVRETD